MPTRTELDRPRAGSRVHGRGAPTRQSIDASMKLGVVAEHDDDVVDARRGEPVEHVLQDRPALERRQELAPTEPRAGTGREDDGRRRQLDASGSSSPSNSPGVRSDRRPVGGFGAHPPAGHDVDRRVALAGRVLDQRDDPAGHEPAGADRRAAAGDLGDLDDAAGGRHLDPTTGSRRDDLERLDRAAGIDDDLDPIAPHAAVPASARSLSGTPLPP